MVSLLESTGDLGLVGFDQCIESWYSCFLLGLCRSNEPRFFTEGFFFGGSGALGTSRMCSNVVSGVTTWGTLIGVMPGTPGAGGGGGGGGGAGGTW